MPDWEELGGEKGKKVQTGRLGRALKLGKLATRVGGSVIAQGIRGRSNSTQAKVEMLQRNAHRVVEAMGELKGAAMKVGQMLSVDPDLLPAEVADHLARLQRNAPPMDFATVREQIEGEFDKPLEDLFRFFDPEPLGAASIGQVHRATRFDGREVAVKIQYPGVVASLDADLRNLKSMLTLGRVIVDKERLDAWIEEARHAVMMEADYRSEAENLAFFHEQLADRPGVRCPEPHLDLTTRHVLTMEFIEGDKLDEAVLAIEDPVERARVVENFISVFVWMFHELMQLHADPHPGNFMLDREGNVVLLDFGAVRAFEPLYADGVLRLLVSYWDGDIVQMRRVFREMGFGTEDDTSVPSVEKLRAYHDIVLEPIATDRAFNFTGWAMHERVRRYLKNNLEFLKFVPPAELMMYFRVVAGMKGFMTKVDTPLNLHRLARETAVRRGIIEAPA
jgi:predicted unusual protein kinase regulating ubiquinone biosynthesis (AarF/ABC1/UbiB family)